MPDALVISAPAKLNLTLRVLGRRSDGYHDIESVVARLAFADELRFRLRPNEAEDTSPSREADVRLACDDPFVPVDDSNLIARAARAFSRGTGRRVAVDVQLTKRIPAGSGLGGGSSDAAATLKALDQLYGTGLTAEALMRIAVEIGADVPLFFASPVCIIRGRGERIESTAARPRFWAALILPEIHSATPEVYAAWDRLAGTRGAPVARNLTRTTVVLDALAKDRTAEFINCLLANDLETAAFETNRDLSNISARIEREAAPVALTGSGAGLFRLFDTQADARAFGDVIARTFALRTEITTFE